MPFKNGYSAVCGHPFVVGTLFILFLLYRYLPSVFAFLLSSSPVVICSFVFLGILLNFGEPNPNPSVAEGSRASNQKYYLHSSGKGKRLPLRSHADGRKEKLADGIGKRCFGLSNSRRQVFFSANRSRGPRKDIIVLGANSLARDGEGGEVLGEEEDTNKRVFPEIDNGSLVQSSSKSGRIICRRHEDSLDVSSFSRDIDGTDNTSDTSSEGDHSFSSSDESEEGIVPMLDELHPLLDAEPIQSTHVSSDEEDGSEDEEAEAQTNEEGEETQEEREDGTEAVMKWTADDEKNVRDVGSSELERNQRLEHLIAKRRAQNLLRSQTEKYLEKNLIDFDSNEPTSVVEELSRLLVMIPPRRNPFDLPCGPEEAIPGSAPSILLPRRNPFDLPEDLISGDGVTNAPDGSNRQVFVTPQPRDMSFRRHESFALGASPPTEYSQEQRGPIFKPYFVSQRKISEEKGSAQIPNNTCGLTDCDELSSVQNSEPISPIHGLHQESVNASSSEKNEQNVRSSGDDGYIENKKGHVEVSVNDYHSRTDVSASNAVRNGLMGPNASISIDAERDIVDDGYVESSCSSDSETNKESIHAKIEEGPLSDLVSARADSSVGSCDSVQSVIAESEIMSRQEEIIDDQPIAEPVYDSSPSALKKPISSSASFEEALLYLDKDHVDSCSSMASDMQVEVSELGSPSKLSDHNVLSGEESSTGNDGLWVAPPNLSFLDQSESSTLEVSEIKEHDVIRDGISLFSPALPQSVEEIAPSSRLSSLDMNSINGSALKVRGNIEVDESRNVSGTKFIPSRLVIPEDLGSRTSSFVESSSDESLLPPLSPPPLFGIAETMVSILPPIPEEVVEDFKHEDEENVSKVFEEGYSMEKSLAVDNAQVPDINVNSTPVTIVPVEQMHADEINDSESISNISINHISELSRNAR